MNRRRGLCYSSFSAFTSLLNLHRFFGAVAQLGERLHGMQEVVGSIPISSTNFPLFSFLVYQGDPVRIISGQARGRHLRSPSKDTSHIRPILARIKKSLFDILRLRVPE